MDARRTITYVGIVVLLVWCPPATAQQSANVSEVATRMAALVAEFRAGATLAEWHAQHPGDAIGPFELNREDTLNTGANVDWGARAIQSITLPGGRRVQRYAYFFVPQPTAGQPLPQGVEDPELTSQCMLGHLWVETEETDEAAGVALARELTTTIERHLGAAERNVKTTFFGAFAWE